MENKLAKFLGYKLNPETEYYEKLTDYGKEIKSAGYFNSHSHTFVDSLLKKIESYSDLNSMHLDRDGGKWDARLYLKNTGLIDEASGDTLDECILNLAKNLVKHIY